MVKEVNHSGCPIPGDGAGNRVKRKTECIQS